MTIEISTIATSAVLLDMSISAWSGRKRDKATTAEVTLSKGAGSSKAASVIKNLMSDDAELDALRAFAQATRLWLQSVTLTWNDSGTRLLSSANMVNVLAELDKRIESYDALSAAFIVNLPLKVSAAAFKLGALFDRAEYPAAETLTRKFSMSYKIYPVPTSGDFRVDVQNDTAEFLKTHFEKLSQQHVAAAMREPWERMYQTLKHLSERVTASIDYAATGGDKVRQPKLFQSLLDNALEMVDGMEGINITGDPQLTECAARMRRVLSGVDIKSLRESDELRKSVQSQVKDMLGAFDFGNVEGDSDE